MNFIGNVAGRARWSRVWIGMFMVHPLRVEPVVWVSGQPYLPCAMFSMLSVLAYLRAFGAGSRRVRGWLFVSFILFVTALLFHAVAVSLPAVLLILDVYPLGRLGDGGAGKTGSGSRNAWVKKLPFVLVSVAFVVVAIAAREAIAGRGGAEQSIGKHCAGLLWDLVLFMEDVTPVEPDRGVPSACADRLAVVAVSGSDCEHGGGECGCVCDASPFTGHAGGVAELCGDPGTELGFDPDQRPDRGRSV